MSKLTDAVESIRSHPDVCRRIHVHRGDVLYNPITETGWQRVTICAAQRLFQGRRRFEQFSLALWPDAIMGPESFMTGRGHTYDRYEDGEQITTSEAWLNPDSVEVISGIPGEPIPDQFQLSRMIELHVYGYSWHLWHCQEPLIPMTVTLRR